MNFSFSYAPGTSLNQMIGFETAGRWWSSYLTDNVKINIYVEPTNTLPVGVAGGALMGIDADRPYSTWRTRLAADRKTNTDQVVHRNLPSNTASFTTWVNEIGPDGMTSNKSQKSSTTLNLSRANAKALRIIGGQNAALDGYILMNNQLPNLGLNWNYGTGGTVPSNRVHFLSVALHEVGHVLGFYSGVDASGWQITPIDGFYGDDDDDDGGSSGEQDPRGPLQNATGLDMFRFSNEDQLDLVIGGSPFFSINGGTTKRADFSTGTNRNLGGDGYQASHWKSNGGALGIMEPSIAPGQRRTQRALDRQSLDAIGWDLGMTTQVNLGTLRNQAKASLANRLGVTVAQLDANPALAQQLTQDRSQDAIAMIEQSQVYEWRWSRRGRRTGYWDSIDLPPAAMTASTTSLRSNRLETGWGNQAENSDSLTATQLTSTALTQARSGLDTQVQTPQEMGAMSRGLIMETGTVSQSSPMIAPMDVLSSQYVIGSEWLQTAF